MPPGAGHIMDSGKVGPVWHSKEWLRLKASMSMKAPSKNVQIQVSNTERLPWWSSG